MKDEYDFYNVDMDSICKLVLAPDKENYILVKIPPEEFFAELEKIKEEENLDIRKTVL